MKGLIFLLIIMMLYGAYAVNLSSDDAEDIKTRCYCEVFVTTGSASALHIPKIFYPSENIKRYIDNPVCNLNWSVAESSQFSNREMFEYSRWSKSTFA